LDTQDVRERKKLPGSVAKLIKGYELRAWWFEIFECGRKARPLAFQHMPRVGTDRPSALADPLDAALTLRTSSSLRSCLSRACLSSSSPPARPLSWSTA